MVCMLSKALEFIMANSFPTLSTLGWVQDVSIKASQILYSFFVANYSQTILFRGKIQSLPYLIHRMSDLTVLRDTVQNAVTLLLNSYFDSAEVTVTLTPIKSESGQVFNEDNLDLQIKAIVTQDGKRYSLGRLVSIANKNIVDIREFS